MGFVEIHTTRARPPTLPQRRACQTRTTFSHRSACARPSRPPSRRLSRPGPRPGRRGASPSSIRATAARGPRRPAGAGSTYLNAARQRSSKQHQHGAAPSHLTGVGSLPMIGGLSHNFASLDYRRRGALRARPFVGLARPGTPPLLTNARAARVLLSTGPRSQPARRIAVARLGPNGLEIEKETTHGIVR